MSAALRYTLVSLRALLLTLGHSHFWPWHCWPWPTGGWTPLRRAAWCWLLVQPRVPTTSLASVTRKPWQSMALKWSCAPAKVPGQPGTAAFRTGQPGLCAGRQRCQSVIEDSPVESLGKLFLEPVWLFYRSPQGRKAPLTSLTQLTGLRVNVGTPGSGVPALIPTLEVNRIDPANCNCTVWTRLRRRWRFSPATGRHRICVSARIADGPDAASNAGCAADGLCTE